MSSNNLSTKINRISESTNRIRNFIQAEGVVIEEVASRVIDGLTAKDNTIVELNTTISDKDNEILDLNNSIDMKNTEISDLNASLESKDTTISNLSDTIAAKDAEIEELKKNQGSSAPVTSGDIMIFNTVEDMYTALGGGQ